MTMPPFFLKENKQYLDHMVGQNALPNGLIFYGPPGSFTTQASEYLVQSTLCLNHDSPEPCGTCASCIRYVNGNHTQVIDVNEPTTISVEKIRWLKEATKYGPSESSDNAHQFVVLHDSETMTQGASNAFLKLLEEPVQGVHFILLTSNIDALLDTIVSRCQSLYFPKISHDMLQTCFENRLKDAPEDHRQAFQQPLSHLTQYDAVLISYLETNDIPEVEYFVSLSSIHNMKSHERLSYAQQIPSKPAALLFCSMWLQDSVAAHQTSPATSDKQAEKLIEIIQNLKYNLNLKLQMESLLLSL